MQSTMRILRAGLVVAAPIALGTLPATSARAAQIETHYVAIDATHCDLVAGGPVNRFDSYVMGASGGSAYTLRCPVEFTHSTGSPAVVTGISGHAFWNMPSPAAPPPSVEVTLTRRVLSTQTRTVVASCSMPPPGNGYHLPASCTGGANAPVDDSTAAYAVEFRTTAWGTRWGASGAVVSYQWSNGP